jgi:hypothetical protein
MAWYGRPVSRTDQQGVGVAVSRFAAPDIVIGGRGLIVSAMGVDAVLLLALLASACGEPGSTSKTGWEGQIDSLPNGQVVVHNGDRGVWAEGAAWQLIADARIGSVDSAGPQSFAFIVSFAVDVEDRVWVLDGQASELRVFDRHGAHVRTIGRLGKGPGEFSQQPVRVDIAPDGNTWVMDPMNARLSIFDSAGSYVDGIRIPGGFLQLPWAGGFDRNGNYYALILSPQRQSGFALGKFDRRYTPLDTIALPVDPVERKTIKLSSDPASRGLTVPLQGRLAWRPSNEGTVWALVTDQYRLVELNAAGDTLRQIAKSFSPIPVTSDEKAIWLERLEPFIPQGARIDASGIPDHKPAVTGFFPDADGYLWVLRDNRYGVEQCALDVFDPAGRYWGTVTAPFQLSMEPAPIVRDGLLFGVARDELDVQYLVIARIVKP